MIAEIRKTEEQAHYRAGPASMRPRSDDRGNQGPTLPYCLWPSLGFNEAAIR